MGLSCSCLSDGDYDWYYRIYPDDFIEMPFTPHQRKCASCGKVIHCGDDCLQVLRYREPRSDVEDRIYGDAVYLSDWFYCFHCGGLFLQFTELGYCIELPADMNQCLRDYKEMERSKW